MTVDLDGNRGLRPDPPDPGTAYPPREGHLQHLHERGPVRAGGRGLPRQPGEEPQETRRIQCPKAQYLQDKTRRLPGWKPLFTGPFYNEFVVSCPIPSKGQPAPGRSTGIVGGYYPGQDYPGTEKRPGPLRNGDARPRGHRWRRGHCLNSLGKREERMDLIFEKSAPAARPQTFRAATSPRSPSEDCHRGAPPGDIDLPEVSELDLVRHYTALSRRNFGVDTGILSPRVLHDEIQPQDQRRGGATARLYRPPSLCPGGVFPGEPALMYELRLMLAKSSAWPISPSSPPPAPTAS